MFAASFVYSYQASFATQQSQRFEGPRSLQEELCVKRSCVVEELCVKVIDEVRGAEDAHTHYHTDDGTSDFMSTACFAHHAASPHERWDREKGDSSLEESDHPAPEDK